MASDCYVLLIQTIANPDYEDIEIGSEHRIIGHVVRIYKDPPLLLTVKNMLLSKEILDDNWAAARELATQHGMDGKQVQKLIELFSDMIKNV